MKLICSLHLKKKLKFPAQNMSRVGARLHHFNCRVLFFLNMGGACPRTPLVFRDFSFLSLGPLYNTNMQFCSQCELSQGASTGRITENQTCCTVLNSATSELFFFLVINFVVPMGFFPPHEEFGSPSPRKASSVQQSHYPTVII